MEIQPKWWRTLERIPHKKYLDSISFTLNIPEDGSVMSVSFRLVSTWSLTVIPDGTNNLMEAKLYNWSWWTEHSQSLSQRVTYLSGIPGMHPRRLCIYYRPRGGCRTRCNASYVYNRPFLWRSCHYLRLRLYFLGFGNTVSACTIGMKGQQVAKDSWNHEINSFGSNSFRLYVEEFSNMTTTVCFQVSRIFALTFSNHSLDVAKAMNWWRATG